MVDIVLKFFLIHVVSADVVPLIGTSSTITIEWC
jgi:hypothetical protein